MLRADGDRQARILQADGQAKAISTVFAAIHSSNPDAKVMAYQYLQALPQIAAGASNKIWIVPAELTKALEGLGHAFGGLKLGPLLNQGEEPADLGPGAAAAADAIAAAEEASKSAAAAAAAVAAESGEQIGIASAAAAPTDAPAATASHRHRPAAVDPHWTDPGSAQLSRLLRGWERFHPTTCGQLCVSCGSPGGGDVRQVTVVPPAALPRSGQERRIWQRQCGVSRSTRWWSRWWAGST